MGEHGVAFCTHPVSKHMHAHHFQFKVQHTAWHTLNPTVTLHLTPVDVNMVIHIGFQHGELFCVLLGSTDELWSPVYSFLSKYNHITNSYQQYILKTTSLTSLSAVHTQPHYSLSAGYSNDLGRCIGCPETMTDDARPW